MTSLLGPPRTAAVAMLGQYVLELGAWSPRIGVGGERKLLGHDFADIEHIPRQRFGRVDLCTQHSLTALRIVLLGQPLPEDDAEGLVELLGHRIEGENAGLHDLAAQSAFHNDLTARPTINGHPSGESGQADETEPPRQCRPLTIGGDNIQRRTGRPHAIQIDKSF